MADYQHLEYEARDRTAIIRLDRPDKLNALHPPLLREIRQAVERAEEAMLEDDVRVALLTGNGRAFSAGYDFMEEVEDLSMEEMFLEWGQYYKHFNAIYDANIPIGAAVDG